MNEDLKYYLILINDQLKFFLGYLLKQNFLTIIKFVKSKNAGSHPPLKLHIEATNSLPVCQYNH